MLEHLPKVHTVDVIKRMDPRRDTGGLGQVISWGIFGKCYNLTTTFYSYLFNLSNPHPIIICLAYLLAYCLIGYFCLYFDKQLQAASRDGMQHCNPRVRYGKGKYKYSQSRPPKKGQRKGRYKPPPRKGKYHKTRKRRFDGWASNHKWSPTLDHDYSGDFDLNCNQYDHYLDAVMNKIEAFTDGGGGASKDYGFTSLEDDVFIPVGLYIGDSKEIPIVFDTGCSVAVTPYKEDFIGPITPVVKTMTGLGSKVDVVGEGKITWVFRDDYGVKQTVLVKGYYIPDSPIRLFSPQSYFQQEGGGSMKVDKDGSTFTFVSGKSITFEYAKGSNLPIAYAAIKAESKSPGLMSAFMTLPTTRQPNISKGQEELLLWHAIFGHYDIRNIQQVLKRGTIKVKEVGATTCSIPMCKSCLAGKAKCIGLGSNSKTPNAEHHDVIKKDDLQPGDTVSTDQYECRIKGRLPYTKGKEDPKKMFSGGTLFVDHATGYIKVYNQVSLGGSDTVRSKELFELHAYEMGIKILKYHGDNGVYKSKAYKEDLDKRHQEMSYSGVGAHGQNGVAERAIQTVTHSARTMMLHQALLWPEQFDMRLWPFALEHAAYLWNNIPDSSYVVNNVVTGISPIELFTGVTQKMSTLKNEHTWGCPAYVLDPKLQDGKKLPKWDFRTRQGQYLGKSSKHASSIGLIRNLKTGFISPQFHVIYDHKFETVMGGYDENDAVVDHIWNNLLIDESAVENVVEYVENGDVQRVKCVPHVHADWLNESEKAQRGKDAVQSEVSRRLAMELAQEEKRESDPPSENRPHIPPTFNDVESEDDEDGPTTEREGPPTHPRRGPPRSSKFTSSYKGMLGVKSTMDADSAFIATIDDRATNKFAFSSASSYFASVTFLSEEETMEDLHPCAFISKVQTHELDNPTYKDILRGSEEERHQWDEAMVKELKSLADLGSFEMVARPRGENVLQSTWAFKRKRYPDGALKKYKARFCVRGDQQIEGVDVFDTYAPVVSWITVRLLLVLSIIFTMQTQQVDYTNAFCQAPLDQTVFVELPNGFEAPNKVLLLKQSVYGLRQSPLNFYKHLRQGLESRGFVKSDYDDCLFMNGDIMVLFWVDDCIFYSNTNSAIDKLIDNLKDEFLLEKEEDMAGFLGLQIDRTTPGTVVLTQTGLINRILVLMEMETCNPKYTPADKIPLGKDEDGDPCREDWEYRSVVGMMLYLAGSTRPDIAYAVHQCARFSHNPKRSHEVGLKHIARYLQGTKDKGMILTPGVNNLRLDLFADADFAGLFVAEDKHDPVSVKSRTGLLLNFGGVPIFWSSKLQSEIALSTLEAEYIALSQGMRELVSARSMVLELAMKMNLDLKGVSTVSKAWEDNVGTQNLANSKGPLMTSRTKHIGIKYHWFRSKIGTEIEILRVSTDLQRADIFTKGLTRYPFEEKRKLVMGW